MKKKEKPQLSLDYNPKYIPITIYIYIYILGILIQSYTKSIFKNIIITPKYDIQITEWHFYNNWTYSYEI